MLIDTLELSDKQMIQGNPENDHSNCILEFEAASLSGLDMRSISPCENLGSRMLILLLVAMNQRRFSSHPGSRFGSEGQPEDRTERTCEPLSGITAAGNLWNSVAGARIESLERGTHRCIVVTA